MLAIAVMIVCFGPGTVGEKRGGGKWRITKRRLMVGRSRLEPRGRRNRTEKPKKLQLPFPNWWCRALSLVIVAYSSFLRGVPATSTSRNSETGLSSGRSSPSAMSSKPQVSTTSQSPQREKIKSEFHLSNSLNLTQEARSESNSFQKLVSVPDRSSNCTS